MIVLNASRGYQSMTRLFTTFRAASIYASRLSCQGWIVKALTVSA